jgi:hypothetical protein
MACQNLNDYAGASENLLAHLKYCWHIFFGKCRTSKRPPPPPGEHLGLFWRKKKHQVFSPAATDETLHVLKLFLKIGK